jgi:hypothetical protein
VRRGLFHGGVWVVATVVAVTLSWYGVRSVLRGTAYDPPRTLPIAAATRPPVISSATHSPRPSPTRSSRPPAAAAPKQPPGTARPATSAPAATGDVRSYPLSGGEVVLALAADSASLVSATPAAGWKMQLWTSQPGWLRVTFTSASGTAASSVFCTWNGHPPTVQTYGN